jgi:hypothetical protein
VNRDTLTAVAPALGDAVSAHLDVAVEALQVGVDGRLRGDQGHVLAGLGSVTLDRGAAAAIERALSAWVQVHPEALVGTGPPAPLPAAAVLGAYVAVQESAQRTKHALDALEDRALAESKDWLWQHSFHLVPEVIPGPGGIILGLAEGYAAIGLDTDGTWNDRVDRGLVFDHADAIAVSLAALAPHEASAVRAVTEQATAAFDRTAAALGHRRAPKSPEADPFAPLADLGLDVQHERTGHERHWRFPVLRLPR